MSEVSPKKWTSAGPASVAAAVALLTFAITLGGTFVYDDFDVFNNDARLRDTSRWHQYWTQSYNGGVDNLYRPITSMTYALQWRLHGDKTKWPYHAVNWLLHAAVSASVAELARRLVRRSNPQAATLCAGVAGAIFAVHPIHVEAVANVVGRAELLAALGVLGGLILFLRRPLTIARSLAILGCFVLAALSKENGLLLAPLILALAICTRFRWVDAQERRATLILILLLCWALAGLILLREQAFDLKFGWDRAMLDWTINPLVRSTGVDRVLMPIALLGRYASLLIAPVELSPDYGAKVIGWIARPTDPYLYLGTAALTAYGLAFVVAIRMRWRLTIFCLIALAITYSIVSNFIILIGTNFGERLMYLPSVFFVLLIAMALCWFLPRRVVFTIAAALVILGGLRSFTYARLWNDRMTFYQASIAQQPNSIRLRMLLIAELQSRGELRAADEVATAARELLPDYDEIWIQRADIALALGDDVRAEQYLRHAMSIDRKRGSKAAARLQVIFDRRGGTATSQPASATSRAVIRPKPP